MKRTTATALALILCLAAKPLAAQETQVIDPAAPVEREEVPAPDASKSPPAEIGQTGLAQSRTYVDVLASLEASGYSVDRVKSTFLSRVKITAQNAVHVREVVVSRSTGEIVSDQVVQVLGGLQDGGRAASLLGQVSSAVAGTVGPVGGAGGSGSAIDLGASSAVNVTGRTDLSIGLGSDRGASVGAAGSAAADIGVGGGADIGVGGAADIGAGGIDIGADLGIGGGIGLEL